MSSRPPFGELQTAIYLAGLAGQRPALPLTWPELEAEAYAGLPPEAVGYVAGGAGSEQTIAANRAAFDHWRIAPSMLRRAMRRDLSTSVCGIELAAPVLLAPVGAQRIVHPDGELATARGAAAVGVPAVLSTLSSFPLEEVAAVAGAGPRWFQLYWPRDRSVAASLVGRAERAGFAAVLVTLDTWLLAWRPRDLRAAYLPFLHGEGLANFFTDPAFRALLDEPPKADPQAAILRWAGLHGDPGLGWEDLAFLRSVTSLPVLVKGVLRADDALRALDAGVDGLVVSNHGGRQVDGAVAALDALPAVVEAVGGRIPVLFDSGVRCAADAMKALALGARAVLLGRPFVWGLALAGADGVAHVLRTFLAELDLNLALSGYATPAELSPGSLATPPS